MDDKDKLDDDIANNDINDDQAASDDASGESVDADALATDTDDNKDGHDEVIVSIGDEQPQEDQQKQAPEWVRELRKLNVEKERRIRELEEKLSLHQEVKPLNIGPEPTLEDYDYDADKFKGALLQWYDQKKQVEIKKAEQQAAEQQQQQAWQAKLDNYGKAKSDLKVRDFEDAEDTVKHLFNVTQQGIVLHGAKNPALLVYALGKNPKKAKELADINDLVKFTFAVAELEKDLKVTSRKSVPEPEKVISSTGRPSGVVDSSLARLRAEAEKTGDYTKVINYKKQLRDKR